MKRKLKKRNIEKLMKSYSVEKRMRTIYGKTLDYRYGLWGVIPDYEDFYF